MRSVHDDYFVIGDVHGQYHAMQNLMEQKPKESTLVFLGDIIDRGTGCLRALREVSRGYKAGNHIVLKGNHEQMLLNFLENPSNDNDTLYLLNGGSTLVEQFYGEKQKQTPLHEMLSEEERSIYYELFDSMTGRPQARITLRQVYQYAPKMLAYYPELYKEHFNTRWNDALDEIRETLRTELAEELAIMKTYPLYLETESWLMSHAGVNPYTATLTEMEEVDFLWLRNDFYEAKHIACTDKRILFGHTPNNRIHSEVEGGTYQNYIWESAGGQLVGIDTPVQAMYAENPQRLPNQPLMGVHVQGKHYSPYLAKKEIVVF